MSVSRAQEQLDAILGEGAEHARRRERVAFDECAGGRSRSVVLYGAGNLGRKVSRALRANQVEPLAFADQSPALAGRSVEGIPVLPPQGAVRRFGSEAVFVICVWHPAPMGGVRQIMESLTALGATCVVPFPLLLWKHADALLPYYLWDLPSKMLEQRADIQKAFAALEAESQAQFVAELRLRILGDLRALESPRADTQYFPRDLFRLRDDECFVDCGAYDGDTIRAFAAETGGRFRHLIAFEADAGNISRLRDYLAGEPDLAARIDAHAFAVAGASGELRFAATAGTDASVSTSGDTVVRCVSLDDSLGEDEIPTMIKMDIEGSEMDALRGAESTVRKHRPLLAVCVYHRPDHLWSIPLWMREREPASRLHLRSYAVDGWESVCYSVPPHRRS